MKALFFLLGTTLYLTLSSIPQIAEHNYSSHSRKNIPHSIDKIDHLRTYTSIWPIQNNTLSGTDVSQYYGQINWNEVRASGVSFAFINTSESSSNVDPFFQSNWSAAGNTRIKRGPLHRYDATVNPQTQANFYLSTFLNGYSQNDLPPAVEIEDGLQNFGNAGDFQNNLIAFLNLVENRTGRVPIIYVTYTTAQQVLNNPRFGRYYLWLSEFDTSQPPIPNAWANSGITFWQNSDSHFVSGIEGEAYHDVFFGGLNALGRL